MKLASNQQTPYHSGVLKPVHLVRSMIIVIAMISVAFGLRVFLVNYQSNEARTILAERMQVDANQLVAQPLHFVRADYRVSFYRSPFEPLHWTVNLHSGVVTSWQSKKKEELVLKAPLIERSLTYRMQ